MILILILVNFLVINKISCEIISKCNKLESVFDNFRNEENFSNFFKIEILANKENETIISKAELFLEKSKEIFQDYLKDEYQLNLTSANLISCYETSTNSSMINNRSIIINFKFQNFTMNSIENISLDFNSILIESILINQYLLQKKFKIVFKQILNELTDKEYLKTFSIPLWAFLTIGFIGLLIIVSFSILIVTRTRFKNKYYVTNKSTNTPASDNITRIKLETINPAITNADTKSTSYQRAESYSDSLQTKNQNESLDSMIGVEFSFNENEYNKSNETKTASEARLTRMLKKSVDGIAKKSNKKITKRRNSLSSTSISTKQKKRNSLNGNIFSDNQHKTGLSNLDGPPAPPPFFYNYNASASRSSLQDSLSLFDNKLNKLPKNTNQVDELEAALDKVNQNLKSTNISISDVSSSSKETNPSANNGNIQSIDEKNKKDNLIAVQKTITSQNNLRIRKLSELNDQFGNNDKMSESIPIEPKPREKLYAKKEINSDLNSLISSRTSSNVKEYAPKDRSSSLGKISISKKFDHVGINENEESNQDGLYLETIDRLVDSKGEVIAKNETVKYLGKSASINDKSRKSSLESTEIKFLDKNSLAKISSENALFRKNSLERIESKEIYIESKSKTDDIKENYAVRLPECDKALLELNKNELEEIAYVIMHHEKNSNQNGRYFYNDYEIYPDGPLKDYVYNASKNSKKFEIEDLKQEEDNWCLKALSCSVNDQEVDNQSKAIESTDSQCTSQIKRLKIINVPKRTMNSNQHFIVDIDNDNILASDLDKVELEKLVEAIDKHRPLIRTITSRYFLNGQEILPKGILRSYFSEYENIEPFTTSPKLNKDSPAEPISMPTKKTPLKVKIENAPLDYSKEQHGRDYCVYLLEEGENKRLISELNESELYRIAMAIGKHWPETRTKNSRFYFHGSEIYPNDDPKTSNDTPIRKTDIKKVYGESNIKLEKSNNMLLENQTSQSLNAINEEIECNTPPKQGSSLLIQKNDERLTSFRKVEPNEIQHSDNFVKIKVINNNSGKELVKCIKVDQPNKSENSIPISKEMAKEVAKNIVKDLLIDHAIKRNLKPRSKNNKSIKPISSCLEKQDQTTHYASLKNLAFKKSGSLIEQDDDENWDPLTLESNCLPKNCKNQIDKQNRISWGEKIIF